MFRIVFAFLVLCVAALPATAEKRVALVIGNGGYGGKAFLPNPTNDATGIEKLLTEQMGFKVIKRLDANHDDMRQAMAEFGREAVGADVALFFYAGHGIELDGANYLLPVGADIDTDVDLINLGFRLDQVVESMVRAGAKAKIVLVDACRTNPFALARGAESLAGLRELPATHIDMLVAFATQPGETADDGRGDHSPFTAGLINNLASPGIAVHSVLLRVRNAVLAATRDKQNPWWSDMFTFEVYLGGRTPGSDVGLTLTEDIALCEKIGGGGNRLMMDAYLGRYPQGFCADAIRKLFGVDAAQLATANAPIEKATSEPAPAAEPRQKGGEAYKVSSYWNHNNSVMALSAQGNSRVFYYEQPRKLIEKAGVSRGTLLFRGKVTGRTYSGEAYIFSERCAPIAYKVSGQASADLTRVELTGQRPVRNESCRQTGTKPDRLVFEYRSKSL